MLTLFGVWLAFALAMSWGGLSQDVFLLFCGNTDRILHGEIWRLVTAPLMQVPMVGPILFTLIGLYFLTPTLEQQWGGKRLLGFLVLSVLSAYVLQMLAQLVLPRSTGDKLVGDYWFSALPALEAIAIAWALTFRGQTVRLFFVIPVTSRGLILFVVGVSVLYLVTLERPACGLLAPFGGMAAGWLFGGGTPSPARRFWLKLRLRQLEKAHGKQSAAERAARSKRVAASGLRVIDGGGTKGNDDDRRGPDGQLLN